LALAPPPFAVRLNPGKESGQMVANCPERRHWVLRFGTPLVLAVCSLAASAAALGHSLGYVSEPVVKYVSTPSLVAGVGVFILWAALHALPPAGRKQ
jgi:hypothetical protein